MLTLTVRIGLQPSPQQADALLLTLERANAAANGLSEAAWSSRTFGQFALHQLCYHETRARTGLSAQVVVRLVSKVADSYKLDRQTRRVFQAHGAIPYDDRILRVGQDIVSIWTLAGRLRIPFVCGEQQRHLLANRKGESDLVYRDGRWYLLCSTRLETEAPAEPEDYLGVDLGIVNIAADSDGKSYSGSHVNGLRHRHARLRRRLQSKGTQSAKRRLRARRRKEQRFATDVNHRISKQIVRVAEDTKRGIGLEDLTGIRSRITARRSQRRTLHSWGFLQLRSFVAYKAALAGVAVAFVDPRNTSRTCPACGHCDKGNRKTRAQFRCLGCDFAGPADTIAAENIRRAALNRPNAGTRVDLQHPVTCKLPTSVGGR